MDKAGKDKKILKKTVHNLEKKTDNLEHQIENLKASKAELKIEKNKLTNDFKNLKKNESKKKSVKPI